MSRVLKSRSTGRSDDLMPCLVWEVTSLYGGFPTTTTRSSSLSPKFPRDTSTSALRLRNSTFGKQDPAFSTATGSMSFPTYRQPDRPGMLDSSRNAPYPHERSAMVQLPTDPTFFISHSLTIRTYRAGV